MTDTTLYFRQLLGGRDFGRRNPACAGMENFVYLVGDRAKKECVIIDPAWAVDELLSIAEADGMRVVGGLGTHYHPDHVGGAMMGLQIEGVAQLVGRCACPIHVHKNDAGYVRHVTGLSASDLALRESGDKVQVGDVEIEWLHTPGHTPGSSCFRLEHALLAGDTVFLQGCGRVDLPGGDKDEMERTLTQRLASLPGDMILYPGHNYGGSHAPLEQGRRQNPMLDPEFFRRMR